MNHKQKIICPDHGIFIQELHSHINRPRELDRTSRTNSNNNNSTGTVSNPTLPPSN